MRFAHFADIHIGSWRDPKMKDLPTVAFNMAVDKCIEEKVDFILIAGDIFNTPLPSIDSLKQITLRLKELQEKDIPVYIIAGSHDFSPSGKTMLDVLQNAGLLVNVCKGSVEDNKLKLNFTIDKKTNTKITGILGKKGMLDKHYYESLNTNNLEKEEGFKIFMFHTALTEFKPKELEKMDSHPLSLLPKKFNYYAGGHVHYIFEKNEPDYGLITYPGPLFPANFKELEKLDTGGMYIVDYDQELKINYVPLKIKNHKNIKINGTNKTPEKIEFEIKEYVSDNVFSDCIVTIRISGLLASGKASDIRFKEIFDMLYTKDAYFIMKSTSLLKSREFEEIRVDTSSSEDMESALIDEHKVQTNIPSIDHNYYNFVKSLMDNLNDEKQEGERVIDYEIRLKNKLKDFLKI